MIDFKKIADEAMKHNTFTEDNRFPPSRYYSFLYLLAKEMDPNFSVISGVCGGGDSFHLSKGSENGQVIGIDIADDHKDNIKFIKDNCPNFIFKVGDVLDVVKTIRSSTIDILFLDSLHTYDHTKKEFNAFLPMLRPGSVVCFDDLFRPGMEDFWNELDYPNKVRLDFLHQSGQGDGGFSALEIS